MSCAKKAERVVLITNAQKDTELAIYKEVLELALSFGAEVRTPEKYNEQCFDPRVKYMSDETVYEGADAAVVLGGDGTILKVASGAIRSGCAILGVNLGRVGYMAEIGKSEISKISRLFEGNYRISERMTLSVWIEKDGKRTSVYENALNDAVIRSGTVGKVLSINLYSGNAAVAEHRGDGIIISTPTGSTAYSMSAGGPVIDPSLECLCITPVCSLSPAARSMVFSAEHELQAESGADYTGEFLLCCDGIDNISVSEKSKIIIKRSPLKARLISIGEEEFFSVFRKKITSAM